MKKNLTCSVCGKVSTRRSNHNRHMMIHRGFTCRFCPDRFPTGRQLYLHLNQSHGMSNRTPDPKNIPDELCGVCGDMVKKFKMNQHMLRHQGLKPHVCKVEGCGKGFFTSVQLKNHGASHSNERNYPCDQCGFSFKSQCNLTVHRKIHKGEKSYQCKDCGRSFTQSYDLVIHQRRHTGEKPYECKNCGEKFITHYLLKKHQTTCKMVVGEAVYFEEVETEQDAQE